MKAGLPEREPELLKRWEKLGLYKRLREEARGREKFILHDGRLTPTATSISAPVSTRSSKT